ncbi:MAG: NIPSNAP family protein [Bacteroidetes bacterium HGW-Bacteroidetes-16]|nr:MAG: NIPSNAP family protein [Bacteroidetes bacterium HGW-Bacteroidetes-16]
MLLYHMLQKSKKQKMITEIRIYKLKENTATEFITVFTEQSLPMMKRWRVNVVDYGFSLIDVDSFYLIRSYESIEQRKESQEAFYGSDEWINGPEKAIMGCIDTYNTSVVDSEKLIINKTVSK